MDGPIGWFARTRVAANLIMVVVIFSGFVTIFGLPRIVNGIASIFGGPAVLESTGSGIKQEVFPEFSLDMITITVPYLGAAPEEVEQAVCVRIEEAIQDLDGVKELTSMASEGVGTVSVKLILGADAREVLDDVKSRIDAIDTFPEETEKAIIQEITNRRQVIDIAIYGDTDAASLRHLSEQVRDEVVALPGITLAELANARPYEISVEVSEEALRTYELTFDDVAMAIRRSSLDLPGGSVKTAGGEILLRSIGQAYRGSEFENLLLFGRPDGTRIRLGDVARVVDGFADTDQDSRFDGKPAALVQVFRTGDQDALGVAGAVEQYIESASARMPEGIKLTTWNDASRVLRDRRDLLLRNGATGILLVVIMLALFMRLRLALWVALGMGISFLGALWMMPYLDVSISLISLFAFILVLGIVVDDAIVVGENIYTHQQRHGDGLRGAIEGAREVSTPVIFAVLTTVAAFLPLLSVAGTTGKIMSVIPLIVIPCLLWSLIESLWILPAHLSHYKPRPTGGDGWHPGRRFQQAFAQGLQTAIKRLYAPSLEFALRWRYLTLAVALATLLIMFGTIGGGFVRFVFFPSVESDFVSAALTLPQGTPVEVTSERLRVIEESADVLRRELAEETGDVDQIRHVISAIGEQPFRRAQSQNAGGFQQRVTSSHLGELTMELLPAQNRTVSSEAIANRWRDLTGQIPDALELTFTSSLFSPGEDVNVQLTGPDIDQLRAAAESVKQRLREYDGVFGITDSFVPGKQQIELGIQPAAEALGLTLSDLARQVRQAFYGEEAQRIQRGRDDLKVMVRFPEGRRRSLSDLENMRIRTPDGRQVPFSEVATVLPGRGFASIKRVDRRRAINVTADVDPTMGATAGDINGDLSARVLPEVLFDYPGVNFSFEGQSAEQRDTINGLLRGFALALVMIYALLAVPLRSYAQPIVIMSAIPFGMVGAIMGHMIMGLDLTILSMFGLVALTGVVVNDSLVMVDFINRHRDKKLLAAVLTAGQARFRPILLTSLTTFAGLMPLMLEKSMQARFLIPMAVSLAFGVIFSTMITLVLVPSGYMVMEDLKALPARLLGRKRGGVETVEESSRKPVGSPAGAA